MELDDLTDGIVIDCELQEAYKGTTLMNERMAGDFPVLDRQRDQCGREAQVEVPVTCV